jgi:hypothetical protein
MCPECYGLVCGPHETQAEALRRWQLHAGGAHARTWKLKNPGPNNPFDWPKHGGQSTQQHRSDPAKSQEPVQVILGNNIKFDFVDFDLLPPGEWTLDDIIKYYSRPEVRASQGVRHREIDIDRLRFIKRSHPGSCTVGKNGWLGYLLFYDFPSTDDAVLECPIKGNAIYVLSGSWKRFLGESKSTLRRKNRSVKRIVHTAGWKQRLRSALCAV